MQLVDTVLVKGTNTCPLVGVVTWVAWVGNPEIATRPLL